MSELKKRIKNIKYLYRWLAFWAGMYLFIIIYSQFPQRFDWLTTAMKRSDSVVLIMFVVAICANMRPLFFVLGIGALSDRAVRCSRCGKKISMKDLKTMGDDFVCPYCINHSFDPTKKTPIVTEGSVRRSVIRTLERWVFKK